MRIKVRKICEKIFGHYSKYEKKDFLFIYLMILLPVVNFAIFWLYVNISSIFLAFQNRVGEFTFDNFKVVYNAFIHMDQYGINLKDSLGRTLIVWIIGLVAFPISIITTYVLFRRIAGHYVYRLCYIIPSLMGAVIWSAIVRYMMGYDGPIIEWLNSIGVELPRAANRNGLLGAKETAFPALCALQFAMALVGNNAVLTGAFSRVPDELYESASLDGAGFWRTCFQIVIPCVGPTIATLLTFSLCGIFTADNGVFLYSNGTGQPEMSTIGFQLYNLQLKIAEGGGEETAYGYPAALGLILTIMTLPIVLIGRRVIDKTIGSVEI